MTVTFEWPSLPERRLAAAKRVAEMCTVHATLKHPPRVTIEGVRATETEAGGAAREPQPATEVR